MKQKDIALIIVVAAVSLVTAVLLSNFLFGGEKAHDLTAEKVQPITGTFEQPSTKYFNAESVDPTETIRIETNSNNTPFEQQQSQ